MRTNRMINTRDITLNQIPKTLNIVGWVFPLTYALSLCYMRLWLYSILVMLNKN